MASERSKKRRLSLKVKKGRIAATASTLVVEWGGLTEDAHRNLVTLDGGSQQKAAPIVNNIETNGMCRDGCDPIVDALYFDIMKKGIIAKKVNRRGRKQARRIFLGVAKGDGFEYHFLSYRHVAQRGGVTISTATAQAPKFWVAHLAAAGRGQGHGASRAVHLDFSSAERSTAKGAGHGGFERRMVIEFPSAIHARGLRGCLLALRDGESNPA